MKYNDIDMKKWKESDINTDSLWVIKERDKSGNHKNIYHGNFIPQIPNQLIRRYTKENDIVFEPFMGSGTTNIECQSLNRKYIGFDINEEIIEYVSNITNENILIDKQNYHIYNNDSTNKKTSEINIKKSLNEFKKDFFQFMLLHPPYHNIVKFTDKKNDLSNQDSLDTFKKMFLKVLKNTFNYLEKDRYFGLVVGDIYLNSEVVPLSFILMNLIQSNFNVKLKGTIVKNIEGNRGKIGSGGIWRYRALNSDYFIFKHEYIFIFKKV